MDYPDYCYELMHSLVEWERRITYGGHTTVSVDWLLQQLHVNADSTRWDDPEIGDIQAFQIALDEMIRVGYVVPYLKLSQVASTPTGRTFVRDPVGFWKPICSRGLDRDEEDVLRAVNGMSEIASDEYARPTWIGYEAVMGSTCRMPDRIEIQRLDEIARRLFQSGYLAFNGSTELKETKVRSTYEGLVWTSRRERIIDWQEVDERVTEWETCTTEFKQSLILKSQDQKAEFIKDILGLANTQANGRRLMIVGFDDKSRRQFVPSDSAESQIFHDMLGKVSAERLEQILSKYTDPPVRTSLKRVKYREGPIMVIEVLRNPAHVPYRVSKELRGEKRPLRPGDTFVRHSSITEPPTMRELHELEAEANRAVQSIGSTDA